jgi:hypothetical protein
VSTWILWIIMYIPPFAAKNTVVSQAVRFPYTHPLNPMRPDGGPFVAKDQTQ